MVRTALLCLFIISVEGASFLKRGPPVSKPLVVPQPAPALTLTQKIPATQKFKLSKVDGVWKSSCDIRGLALGGWFVPEKFINIQGWATPDMPKSQIHPASADTSIYAGHADATDMCTLSERLGRAELDRRMQNHLASFITEKDFEYIASTGVNTLRIPVAYWNVVTDPYEKYAPINPANSLVHLDHAMEWARKHDLAVMIDLHASPGSQNGWEHSGCAGKNGLFTGGNAARNQAISVDVIAKLAERYANHPALLGIEVINEPTGYQPKTLIKLYKDSYDAVRKFDKEAWVIVYAHNLDRVQGLTAYPELHNLVLDKHNYACFGDGRKGPPGQTVQHHTEVALSWQKDLHKMNKVYPTIMGEWSLCHGGGSALKLNVWNDIQQKTWASSTIGSVFWTYKTLTDNARWSYRVALDTVDVMGDLPRCRNEDAKKKKVPKFLTHHSKEEVDAGYEWELELERAENAEPQKKEQEDFELKERKAQQGDMELKERPSQQGDMELKAESAKAGQV